jgi:adenine-specific DNA-methyltransferase
MIKKGDIMFGDDESTLIKPKKRIEDVKDTLRTIIYEDGRTSTKIVDSLIGRSVFDNPKSHFILSRLIDFTTHKDSSDIVLDFFSGSGSTAHATLMKNSDDSGNRKHIQVQLPELTDKKSEAYKQGYKNICEIGKERIRQAAMKIKEETKADIDYGFRVYRLDNSNMQEVYYKPQDCTQKSLDLFADNVKADRTPNDLLAQIMLHWGLPLSLKIERATINGKEVFKVAENSLYACFDNNIDEAFAKEIAKDAPLRIVFKDSGFKSDTSKTNVKQLFKQLSPETEMKVI